MRRILLEHKRPQAFSALAVRAALCELLVGVVRDHELAAVSAAAGRPCPQKVRAILEWIGAALADIESTTDIAEQAGMSVRQSHRPFRQELNVSPNETSSSGGWRRRSPCSRMRRFPRRLLIAPLTQHGRRGEHRDHPEPVPDHIVRTAAGRVEAGGPADAKPCGEHCIPFSRGARAIHQCICAIADCGFRATI